MREQAFFSALTELLCSADADRARMQKSRARFVYILCDVNLFLYFHKNNSYCCEPSRVVLHMLHQVSAPEFATRFLCELPKTTSAVYLC